jgi:hypothetical protein
VAVCGLAGLLVVALLAGPRLAPMAVLWWCGALLAAPWGTGPLLAGLALAAATDLHGAAVDPHARRRPHLEVQIRPLGGDQRLQPGRHARQLALPLPGHTSSTGTP